LRAALNGVAPNDKARANFAKQEGVG
jgi:hypothetical protein